MVTRVRAIPGTRADQQRMGDLTRAAVEALLAAPERSCWRGRRDHAWRLTLDNRGARVSDVTTVHRDHVCCGATTCLDLQGQGRTERTVPFWPHTRRT